MNTTYEAIEQAARQLTIKQKAALAHTLLKDLDEGKDEDVTRFGWKKPGEDMTLISEVKWILQLARM